MKHLAHDFFEFFTFTIIVRYMIAHWIAEWLGKILKKIFIKTEKDLIIFLHARNKAFKKSK